MINPDENEWSRFHQLREGLSELPASELRPRIDRLREEGETTTVINLLELHFRLAAAPELRPGRRLANHYTLRQKLGEGGMGVVYRAVQDITNQEVAVKVIHPALVSSRLIKRFHEEISTLGKLRHDHIVRVFDARQDRDETREFDLLFYAMQLVEGVSLIRWVRETRPAVEVRLDCFVRICEAVDYAHRNGVVHRDLKPDNILVDADGRPAILDFGLAQVADAAFKLPGGATTPDSDTVLQVSGTPAYLSRERWDGQPGGVAADVFALGVILHEMLTDQRPWRVEKDAPVNDLRRAIRDFSPRQLREQRLPGRPLAALLGAMLAPDPADRPASAAEVATQVRATLRRRRLVDRVRRSAPVWGSLMVAAFSALITQAYYRQREAVMNESRTRLNQAEEFLRERSRIDALDQVTALLPSDPRRRHSQDEWRDAVITAMSRWNVRWRGAVSLPRGFKLLEAAADGAAFFGQTAQGGWQLLPAGTSGTGPRSFAGTNELLRARFHPHRSEMALLERTGRVMVWNWDTGLTTTLISDADADTQFEFSPDGRFFAGTAKARDPAILDIEPVTAVRVFDTGTWRERAVFAGRGEPADPGGFVYVRTPEIDGLAFSPDGEFLAAWSDSSAYVPVWNLTERRLALYAGNRDGIAAAAWRPDAPRPELTVIRNGGEILSWAMPVGVGRTYFAEPTASFAQATLHARFQGRLEWAASHEELLVIDEGNQELMLFRAGEDVAPQRSLFARYTNSFQWVSHGRLIETASGPVWDRPALVPPIQRTSARASPGAVGVSFHPAGGLLVVSDASGLLFLDAASMNELGRITNTPINAPASFHNDTGDLWAYGKNVGPICWTVSENAGEVLLAREDKSAGGGIGKMAVAGDHLALTRGAAVFVGHASESFALLDSAANFRMPGAPDQLDGLSLSRDGRTVAAFWQRAHLAQTWHFKDGAWTSGQMLTNTTLLRGLYEWSGSGLLTIRPALQRTAEEQGLPSGAAHWPAGTWLSGAAGAPVVASATERGVHVDFLADENCRHIGTFPMEDHLGRPAVALAVSRDGNQVATILRDGSVRLWDLRPVFVRLRELQLDVPDFDPGPPEARPPLKIAREISEK